MNKSNIELFLTKIFLCANGESCGNNETITDWVEFDDIISVTKELGFDDLANKMESCLDENGLPKEDTDPEFDAWETLNYEEEN